MVIYTAAGAIAGHPDLMGRARDAVRSEEVRPELFGVGGTVSRNVLTAVTCAVLESHRVRSIEAAHHVRRALAPVTGLIERENGVVEDFRSLHVLRETRCPAILVEVDFLSNRLSEQKLSRRAYRLAIAEAISEAAGNFLAESSAGVSTP